MPEIIPFPPPPVDPDPLVVDVARQFRASLIARESAEMLEMTRRWLEMEAVLQARIDALAEYIAAEQTAGRSVKLWKIYRLERYRELLAQVKDEISKYVVYSADLISRNQFQYAVAGLQNARAGIDAVYDTYQIVRASYNILPVSAVEFMVGFAGDGSPLRSLLREILPDAVSGLTSQLAESITLGLNPRETARRMRDGFGFGLNRALNIARTEQLRAFRESTRLQYSESGITTGYKRVATHDPRVCAACLIAEGTIYPNENHFEEHPQGRCTMIPILSGIPPITWLSGKDYLRSQPETYQRTVLGNGRYNLWKNGEIELDDIVQRHRNEIWGNSLNPKPIYRLRGFDSRDAYLDALASGEISPIRAAPIVA